MNIKTLKELIQKEAERNEDVWDFKEEVFKLIDLFEKDNNVVSDACKETLDYYIYLNDDSQKPRKTFKERIAEKMEEDRTIPSTTKEQRQRHS